MREQQHMFQLLLLPLLHPKLLPSSPLLSSPLLWTLVDASVPGRFHGVNLKAVRFLPSSLQ